MPPRLLRGPIRARQTRLTSCCLLLLLVSSLAGPAAAGLGRGDRIPDLSFNDLDGGSVAWSELQDGKPLVVVFWATWCKVCKKDWPELIELHEELDAEETSIAWAAVSVGEKSRIVAREVKARGLVGTQLLDPEEENFEALGLKYVPHVYVFDAEGTVAYSGAPKVKKLRKVLGKILDELQQRRTVTEETR